MRAPIAIGLLLHLTTCFAQPSPPAFEAATIKPSKANDNSTHWNTRAGYLNMRNQTLTSLVAIAWHVKDDQVSGGPKWIASDRFDIEARAAVPAGDPELLAMLQTFLVERFQLAVHRDTKTGDGFALVPAKAGGLKIRPDESAGGQKSSSRRGTMEVQRVPMTKLADTLSRILGASVVDMTNAPGVYSFKLEWSPESMQQRAATPDSPPPADTLGPSLFTVLQQQLGLKLETKKVRVDMVVVDKAEKPSEN